MSCNLSFKQLRCYEILIAFLFLGLSKGLCLNLSVSKDCQSFLKDRIHSLKFPSVFFYFYLQFLRACFLAVDLNFGPWGSNDTSKPGGLIIFLHTNLPSNVTPLFEAILLYSKTLSSFSLFERFCVWLSLSFFSIVDIPKSKWPETFWKVWKTSFIP